MPMLVIFLVF